MPFFTVLDRFRPKILYYHLSLSLIPPSGPVQQLFHLDLRRGKDYLKSTKEPPNSSLHLKFDPFKQLFKHLWLGSPLPNLPIFFFPHPPSTCMKERQ